MEARAFLRTVVSHAEIQSCIVDRLTGYHDITGYILFCVSFHSSFHRIPCHIHCNSTEKIVSSGGRTAGRYMLSALTPGVPVGRCVDVQVSVSQRLDGLCVPVAAESVRLRRHERPALRRRLQLLPKPGLRGRLQVQLPQPARLRGQVRWAGGSGRGIRYRPSVA